MDVVGIDISEVGVMEATRRESSAEFAVGDATQLPIADNEFDLVFCHGFSLFNTANLDEYRPFVDGALDALKPGGTFMWGKTTSLQDTDVGSRYDHSLRALSEFFEGFDGTDGLRTYATIPHLCPVLRRFSLNTPLTQGLSTVAKVTGLPIRAYCLVTV